MGRNPFHSFILTQTSDTNEIRVENISELKRWGEATLQAIQKQSLIKRLILVDPSQKEKNHIK